MGMDWGSWQPFGGPEGSGCPSMARGRQGRAMFVLVREWEKLFLFHFPPTESSGRELAACRGDPLGHGGGP